MTNNNTKVDPTQPEETLTAPKAYEKPVLILYGDVRDVTLGPTVGTGESGCAALFRPGPGFAPGERPPECDLF